MITRSVTTADIAECMDFLEQVKDDFAGSNKETFFRSLKDSIERDEAILTVDDQVARLLLFSRQEKDLHFLAVHPKFPQRGIAKTLIEHMLSSFQHGYQVQVITFREGDEQGSQLESAIAHVDL